VTEPFGHHFQGNVIGACMRPISLEKCEGNSRTARKLEAVSEPNLSPYQELEV
jgi:hypothetical protein